LWHCVCAIVHGSAASWAILTILLGRLQICTDSEGSADSAQNPLSSIGWRAAKKIVHPVHRHEPESAWVRRARAVCWPVLQPCPRCSTKDYLAVFEKRDRSQLLLIPADRCCSSARRASSYCFKQCHAISCSLFVLIVCRLLTR
jgi:hypothetical protein